MHPYNNEVLICFPVMCFSFIKESLKIPDPLVHYEDANGINLLYMYESTQILAAGRTTFEMNKLKQSIGASGTYAPSCYYLKPNQLERPAFASAVFFPTVLSKVSDVS